MSKNPMRGLSKEERRQRALEMLKAKPRKEQPKEQVVRSPRSDQRERERELEERERELEERARGLEERERRLKADPGQVEHAPAPEEAGSPARAPHHGTVRETREPTRAPGEGRGDDRGEISGTLPTAPAPSRRQRLRERRTAAPDPAEVVAERTRGTKARRTAAGTLLDLVDMDVHYGRIQALRGLNLTIGQAEVVALLGANGAGKSSTLKAISGMVSPSAGEILFAGQPIGGLAAFDVVKRGISHVPEGRELFPTLTVEENLRLGYWPQRKSEAGTLKQALERVYTMFPRLGERRAQPAGTMSGGEQQMLAFGRALMPSPRLLLVDEMSLGLAPLIVRTLFDAVDTIHREGASVIIVEQFVHQALRHAQRAYVLAKGEVVLEARSDKLRNDPNLLAAYLGGAEGHIEEPAEEPKPAPPKKRGASRSPQAGAGK